VTAWSYPSPHDVYNLDASAAALFLDRSSDGHGYYPAVDTEGALVGFAVFGLEARVRGQQVVAGTLDVGADCCSGDRPRDRRRGARDGGGRARWKVTARRWLGLPMRRRGATAAHVGGLSSSAAGSCANGRCLGRVVQGVAQLDVRRSSPGASG